MFLRLLFADEGKLTVLSQKLQFNFTNHCGSQISNRLSYFNPTFHQLNFFQYQSIVHTCIPTNQVFDCNLFLENIQLQKMSRRDVQDTVKRVRQCLVLSTSICIFTSTSSCSRKRWDDVWCDPEYLLLTHPADRTRMDQCNFSGQYLPLTLEKVKMSYFQDHNLFFLQILRK